MIAIMTADTFPRTGLSLWLAIASTIASYVAVAFATYRHAKHSLEDRFVRCSLEAWLGPVCVAAGAVWPVVLVWSVLTMLYPPRRDRRPRARTR